MIFYNVIEQHGFYSLFDKVSVAAIELPSDVLHVQTVQRLMLSKGAKRTIFYHITEILQYCLDKTIARSGDMYRDDFGISTLVLKCFGITNTSVQNFAIRISSVKVCGN